MKIPFKFDEEAIKSFNFVDPIIETAITAAATSVRDLQETLPELVTDVESSGARFLIPLAVPEGVASGDERIFDPESISVRDLPLPLRWQIISDEGHKGSVVVGRIDSIERVEGGLGNARGVFDIGAYGRECERLVRGKFLRGVSVDVDKFEASQAPEEGEEKQFADKDEIKNQKIRIKAARLMGITVVPMPAFQEATIIIEEEPTLSDGDDLVEDGFYEEQLDNEDEEFAAIVASAAPVIPPREWFTDPKLTQPTPLKITDEGEVFGHIALWDAKHIGLPRATKPPHSSSKYAYFRTGELRTTDGDVQVGQLTLSGGHADGSFNAHDAVKHYDDTKSAKVDVICGEDKFGIFVRGALRPEVTPIEVRALRASSYSGDWRPINGRLELVAVCAVNVPGFMTPRAIVASAGGQITSLIAAGAAPLAEMKENQRFRELDERIAKMEFSQLEKRKSEILSRFSDFDAEDEIEADKKRARAIAFAQEFEMEDAALVTRAMSAMSRMDISIPEAANPVQEFNQTQVSAEQIEALRSRFND